MVSLNVLTDIIDQVTRYVYIINTCEFVIGLVANVTACVVISCSRSLHTHTGFYLLSLSISDLLTLIMGLSYTLHSDRFGHIGDNPIVRYGTDWIFQTSVIVSTLTVTAFTVERYVAICHPFFVQSIPKKSRVKRTIVIIWSISGVLALLPLAQILISHYAESENLNEANDNVMQYIADIWAILYFFIPMSVITVMYVLIWLKLKKGSNERQIASQTNRADTRTLIMFVVIVVVFFFSWAPFYIYRLLATNMLTSKYRSLKIDESFLILGAKIYLLRLGQQASYSLSSVLNPVIYLMMSKNFRNASKDLLWQMKTGRNLVDLTRRLFNCRIK